jgi:anti-sigma factor RsiW
MNCSEARAYLLDRRRGTLAGELLAPLEAHLAGCAACRHEDAADRVLSDRLEQYLPKRPAPASLKRALEARWAPPRPRTRASNAGRTVVAIAVGAALAVGGSATWRARSADGAMVAEAVNDHLRVLYSEHPLDVESGGIHQVKPWFEGRLDFSPVTAFAGDEDFPLQGGAVAYFLDRKAATYVFKRRLHEITLFVFRAEGLSWPAVGLRPIGGARGTLQTSRGFHVLLWNRGDLGYALVSDVDERDLDALGAKIAGP